MLEMCLKLLVLGGADYFKDPYNTFDAFIVTLAVLDLALIEPLTAAAAGGFAVRAMLSQPHIPHGVTMTIKKIASGMAHSVLVP